MEVKQSIHELLSATGTTATARFEFAVPETVEADLAACYRRAVEDSLCVFEPDSNTRSVLKSAANWLRAGKSGLLLTGGVGTGKTKLMRAIDLLIRSYAARQSLRIFSAPEICRLALSNDARDVETVARLGTYLYAGIDDLGTEPVTVKSWGTELSPVIDALYARYDAGLATVITTNDDMKTLRSKYGERIYDRICGQYDRIAFNFKSFRR
jgi:DNA replication protein DnaC